MRANIVAFHAMTVALLALIPAGHARAGGVIECNNCASPRDRALQSGPGLTVIVDFENAQLTASTLNTITRRGAGGQTQPPFQPR